MAKRKKPKIIYIDDREDVSMDELLERELDQGGSFVELPEEESTENIEYIHRPRNRGSTARWVLTSIFGLIFLTVLAAFIFIPIDESERGVTKKLNMEPNCMGIHPQMDWGYNLGNMVCSIGVLEEGKKLPDLLIEKGIGYKQVIQLQELLQKQKLPGMIAGNTFTLLADPKEPRKPLILAYEPDHLTYVFLNLKGKPAVHFHGREILESETVNLSVPIRTTLADALFNREFGLKLASGLEEALKYKVDLFHLEPGDHFTLLFNKKTYEGDFSDIEDVSAIRYNCGGEEKYAFLFEDAFIRAYYDIDGKPLKSGFLMAPLEYGRISSPFNLKRVDPIYKDGRIIPHLGTDYAAPEGTPIVAVADGIIMESQFKGGNGNYVKILHTEEIQTQYLHMQKFADGIGPGVQVHQGQVIGYVGSTGRSTGPHVCFRFWKNGKQVDHRKEDHVTNTPSLKGNALALFMQKRDSLMDILNPI